MGCTYSVQVELGCQGQVLTGNAPFYYTSPQFVKNANPQALPQMTINLRKGLWISIFNKLRRGIIKWCNTG